MRKDDLEAILQMTLAQEKELANDHYEGFIELLEDRQKLIDKVEESTKEAVLTEEEKVILRQIKEVDDRNTVEYNRQLEEAKSELRKINYLKNKNAQYINPYDMLGKGMYIDKK